MSRYTMQDVLSEIKRRAPSRYRRMVHLIEQERKRKMNKEAKIETLRKWLIEHIDDYIGINDDVTSYYTVDTTKLATDLIEQKIAGE